METNGVRIRLIANSSRPGIPVRGIFARVLTFVAACVALTLAFVFSLLVFAIVVAGGLTLLGYFWWNTRKLRRQLHDFPPDGRVIEGEVIRNPLGDRRTR
jgi:Flp pilus assembly protein TadB